MPEKLCECGCGLPAPIARRTDRRAGLFKGHPARFIKGHNRKEAALDTALPAPVAAALAESVAAPVQASPANATPPAPVAASEREQELTASAASKRDVIRKLEQQELEYELLLKTEGVQPADSMAETIDKTWARTGTALKRARADLLRIEKEIRNIRTAKERATPPPDPRQALKEKLARLKEAQP